MVDRNHASREQIESALAFNYKPPGPVAAEFLKDTQSRLCGIMGPFGSGKTSACPIKGQWISQLQWPTKADGVIRSKGYVIRSTYRDLWDKTLEPWFGVFPHTEDWPFSGTRGGPATHVIRWKSHALGRPTDHEMIVEFRAIGDQNYEEFARGLYATWIWLNEADTINEAAVGPLLGRLGRYPPAKDTVDSYPWPAPGQVICDFNAPNYNNWTVRRFMRARTPGAKLYVQPSGLSEAAENPIQRKQNPNYYHQLAADMEVWEVERFIKNKIGYSRHGKPVYEAWDPARHRSETMLQPWRAPILIGLDAGFDAAAVIAQRDVYGRVQVLQEVVAPEGVKVDAQSLGEWIKELVNGEYAGLPALAMVDPSAEAGSANVMDQTSWIDAFQEASGIPTVPAPTNEPMKRIKAVKGLLNGRVNGKEKLIVDGFRCEVLCEGFAAGYRIRKTRDGDDVKYEGLPVKNRYSHVHDAMQYLALLCGMESGLLDEAFKSHANALGAVGSVHGAAAGQVLNDF